MFYTYYIKAKGKVYIGSRTSVCMKNREPENDFMIRYFSSTDDDELKEIIKNKTYDEAKIWRKYDDSIQCYKDEQALIRIFWKLFGKDKSWNHSYRTPNGDAVFSMTGRVGANKGKDTWNKGKKGVYSKETLNQMSESQRIVEANKSDEEKLAISMKKSSTMRSKSREEINNMLKKRELTKANKSDEEKLAEHIKRSNSAKKAQENMTDEQRLNRNKKCSENNKGKPKPQFQWQTPEGEIKIMDKRNALKWHPDWTFIGPVED